jgi:multicomponent Na+:H+ antiporter subunit E
MRAIKKIFQIILFSMFYIKELVLANFRVLHDVLTPRHYMKPGFVAVPLEAKSDLEILVLLNLISMTPGTLSVDVSANKEKLFIHVMYLDDIAEFRTMIKDKFESRVLEVLR